MTAAPRTPRRGGFTLLELILAVAIFAVVAGVAAAVFHTGVSAWRAGTAAADSMHHIDAVLEQVTAGLRSAYYPESREPLDKYGFVQENDGDDMPKCSDKISWVKIGPSLVGEYATFAGVPHRTELFLMDDGEGPQGAGLYVRAWRLDGQEDDFDPERDVEPVLLSSAVSGFDCKMVDREKEPEPGEPEPFEWLDEWETTNRVPESVLISLSVQPDPETKLPPVIVTRRVEIPLADLSWNPLDTKESSDSSQRRRRTTGGDADRNRPPGEVLPSRGTRDSRTGPNRTTTPPGGSRNAPPSSGFRRTPTSGPDSSPGSRPTGPSGSRPSPGSIRRSPSQ